MTVGIELSAKCILSILSDLTSHQRDWDQTKCLLFNWWEVKSERIERIHFAESSGLGDVKHDIVTFFQSLCQIRSIFFQTMADFKFHFWVKLIGLRFQNSSGLHCVVYWVVLVHACGSLGKLWKNIEWLNMIFISLERAIWI